MKIYNINKYKSDDSITISADFLLLSGKKKEIYIKVPIEYEDFIVADAGTFFPLGVVLAMKLGEDLIIEEPLPERSLHNWKDISNLLIKWNVGFNAINLINNGSCKENYNAEGVGAFFSGGVDSFYTLLKNKLNTTGRISHLILVHGFDVEVRDKERFEAVLKNIEQVKNSEHVELITIETNLRDFTDEIISWIFGNGAAIACVGLLLRKGLTQVHIPATFTFDTLMPSGTHPELDPLWGTETLSVLHDGFNASRLEKTKYISHSELALSHLRVCWKNVAGKYNCSSCLKCLRTMIDLKIAGKLEKAKTFASTINLNALRKICIRSNGERVFFEQSLHTLQSESIYPELQNALKYVLFEKKHNGNVQKLKDFFGVLDKKYNKSRISHYVSKRRIK